MDVDAIIDELLADFPEDPIAQRGRQYDLGLAWVHHPVGRGGLGLDPALQGTITRRIR